MFKINNFNFDKSNPCIAVLQDLRVQLRARGLSPAGGMEQMADRLKEAMISSNDFG